MTQRLALIRTLLFIALCAFFHKGNAQKIIADYDSRLDFKRFRTYSWLAPGDSVLNRYRSDKVFAGTITYAANQELKNKGMKIDTLKPDAIFVFETNVKDITIYTQGATLSMGVSAMGPGYYVNGSAPVAGGKITESTMEGGTLMYVMYDTSTGKLVWSGKVEKKFHMSDDIQRMINDYTKRIFKKLPIKNK